VLVLDSVFVVWNSRASHPTEGPLFIKQSVS